MDFALIARYFEHRGGIYVLKINTLNKGHKKALAIRCEINFRKEDVSLASEALQFIGYGRIYEYKKDEIVTGYRLRIQSKADCGVFLPSIRTHLRDKVVINQVDYVLNSFNFNRNNNLDTFDITHFRSLKKPTATRKTKQNQRPSSHDDLPAEVPSQTLTFLAP